MKAPIPTETQECEAFHQWLDLKKIKHHHIASESQSGRRDAVIRNARNKRMGQSRGFPDYTIVLPNRVVFLEMKRAKKSLSKVSPEQQAWIDALNDCIGVEAVVCYGCAEAIEFVERSI